MQELTGLKPFETRRCLQYHLTSDIPYDGWKYNFKSSKITLEKYLQQIKGGKWAYMQLEKEFPTKNDQLMFWYPFCRMVKYAVPGADVKVARKSYLAMQDTMKKVIARVRKKQFTAESLAVITAQQVPAVYELGADVFSEDYFLAVTLFLVFPQLNSVTSNEPFVYDEWKKQVDLDKPFVSLYVSKLFA